MQAQEAASGHSLRSVPLLARGEIAMTEDIQYACFQQTWLGEIYIARSHEGIVAVQIGHHGEPFGQQIQARFGGPVRPNSIALSDAIQALRAYLNGEKREIKLAVDWCAMSTFQRKVLQATRRIPAGSVATYGEIAAHIGQPKAFRAVGQALKRNPMPLVIPCHRVIAADGSMCGYGVGQGIPTKRALLRLEGFLGA
jgi:methylated-DNA-[protein]-cysteine S-methyltransferase